jgi:Fe-S oxidoreductase/nitrate reductase gamma subunit
MEKLWTREIFWNVGADRRITVYLLGLIALSILFYGLYRRYFLWAKVSQNRQSISLDAFWKRMRLLIIDGLFQRRILKECYPGLMHAFLLWGFIILFLGTITIAFQEDITLPVLGIHFLDGRFYLFYKLILNVAGLLALFGIMMALVRRYVIKPARLNRNYEDSIILIWIFIILTTGFVLEGLRIYSLKADWEMCSIGGWFVSEILSKIGVQSSDVLALHKMIWWTHLFIAFIFIAYIPFSKLIHLLTSPANIVINGLTPHGILSRIARFDRSNSFGVSKVTDFTPRQMFDFDACTQCGRCQDNCPAYLSEKPLSPKKVIEELKFEWIKAGKLLRKRGGSKLEPQANEGFLNKEGLIEEDVIWSCTLCMACFESCPVYISAFYKIIDMRRNLVLMKSKMFPEVATFFRNVEVFGDSFGKGRALREDWTLGKNFKKISNGDQADILYWVGCQGTFHDRDSLIAASLGEIFQKAGIDFGILGKEEICCGDPIRRIGNEYLFQKIAKRNIELLGDLRFKKIVTYCPHCFNTLKNEYPQFGGQYEVVHYTELLRDFIKGEKLKVTKDMEATVIYHDPCYLARANNIYTTPRELLKSIPGIRLLETEHSKKRGFCCGAGGGHMWMREIPGKKINEVRVTELTRAKPEMIATSCPYCLVMLEDGIKSLGIENVKCLDIIEMIRDMV